MRLAIVAVSLVALAAGAGCNKNKKVTNKPVADAAPVAEATPAAGEEARTGLPELAERVSLSTIFFELDSHTLSPEAKAILDQNAKALLENGEVTVRVEGHCDERGSTQYNLALGDRRATAVKQYLTALGIQGSRLEVVSYGEERAADQGHDDAAWAKNRRVELMVTAGSDRVSSSAVPATTR